MKRLNIVSLLYLATAAAFAAIGCAQNNLELWLTAGFALACAVLSLFPWWHQVIIAMGKKGNFMFDAVAIASASVIQAYGLISETFSWSSLLLGFVIVMLISTLEDAIVLKGAEKMARDRNVPQHS